MGLPLWLAGLCPFFLKKGMTPHFWNSPQVLEVGWWNDWGQFYGHFFGTSKCPRGAPFQHSLWGLWIHRYTIWFGHMKPLWKGWPTANLLVLPGVAAGAATDEAAIAPEQTHGKSDLAQVAGARGSNFHEVVSRHNFFWVVVTRVGICYTTAFLWTQQLGLFCPRSFAEGGTGRVFPTDSFVG